MSLRWEDERYVRFYTRDTPHWVLGPWEARAMLGPVLRKLDRAGVMDLGDEPMEALAVVVGLPLEVVERGMAWWVRKGTFEIVAGRLVMPNFLEAQEAKASDAQRAREYRGRARDKARSGDDTVTPRDDNTTRQSDTVTPRDGTVTPSLPSRTEPAEPEERGQLALGSSPDDSSESSSVRAVFDHWASSQAKLTGAPIARMKLTNERRSKIKARLRDKYSVEDLKKAIDGMFATPFNVEGKFTDVELACRDGAHVDRFMQPVKPALRLVQPPPAEGSCWEAGK